MKTKQNSSAKKRKFAIHPFIETTSYRIPLPVTKVIVYSCGTAYPICPRCLLSLEREYQAFCDRCGQRLNWNLLTYAKICYPGSHKE